MVTINCKKIIFKALHVSLETVLLEINGEEKQYSLEGIISLSEKYQENIENLTELNKAKLALQGKFSLAMDQRDIFN